MADPSTGNRTVYSRPPGPGSHNLGVIAPACRAHTAISHGLQASYRPTLSDTAQDSISQHHSRTFPDPAQLRPRTACRALSCSRCTNPARSCRRMRSGRRCRAGTAARAGPRNRNVRRDSPYSARQVTGRGRPAPVLDRLSSASPADSLLHGTESWRNYLCKRNFGRVNRRFPPELGLR